MKNNSLFSFTVFICFLVAGYMISTRAYRTGYGMSGVINRISTIKLYGQVSDRNQVLKYPDGTREDRQSAMGLPSIAYPSVRTRSFGIHSTNERSEFVRQFSVDRLAHQDIYQVAHAWKNGLNGEYGSTCNFLIHEVSALGY